MAFCTNCGAALPEGGGACPNCGFSGGTPGPDPQQYQQYQYQQQYRAVPPGYDEEDIRKNRILSVCAYLSPVMLLIPLIAQPDSKYCRFHANQALVLLLFELCCGIVCIVPILGWIVGGVGIIFAAVCEIIGIVRSLSGKVVPLPLIGKLDILH